MGKSANASQLGTKLVNTAKSAGQTNRKAVSAAALVTKKTILGYARKDTGGDLKLSRWGRAVGPGQRKGVKVGAGYDVKGYDRATALLRARPTGVWRVLNDGAVPHDIGRKKRSKSKALYLGGEKFAASVKHPGTRGKRTWDEGARLAKAPAARAYRRVMSKAMLAPFK